MCRAASWPYQSGQAEMEDIVVYHLRRDESARYKIISLVRFTFCLEFNNTFSLESSFLHKRVISISLEPFQQVNTYV